MSTKIERNATPLSSAKSQTANRAPTLAPVSMDSRTPAAEGFTPATAPPVGLNPQGKPVRGSADPTSLWGASEARPEFDTAAFARLSPAEQAKALEEMKERRGALGNRIHGRVEELDKRWKYSRLVSRTESLRDLQAELAQSRSRLPPSAQAALDQHLAAAEAAQKRIDALKVSAEALGTKDKSDPAVAAQRKQLASELRKAKSDQSAAVKAATEVVDAQGLKIDRLAEAEQMLDPSAPPKGSEDSLFGMVQEYFQLTSFISCMHAVIDLFKQSDEQRKAAQEEDRVKDQLRQIDQQRVERRRRDEEDLATRAATLRELLAPRIA